MFTIRSRRPHVPTAVLFLFTVVVVAALLTAAGLSEARASAAQEQTEAVQLMEQGIAKLQEGKPEEGLAELEKAIEAEPRLAQAHFYAGMANGQLQQWEPAYEHFVAAGELSPGYGEAHMQACRTAYSLGKFEESWEQAILAAQAGVDMQAAFDGLAAQSPAPDDLTERLEAPRILIGNIDTSAILEQSTLLDAGGAGATGADQRGAPPGDPFADVPIPGASAGAFPLPIGEGGSAQLAQIQADLFEIRRRFGIQLADSRSFGVVPRPDLSEWVFFIKVDFVGDAPPPRPLRGFIKLLDTETQEEVYSRPLELSNITSVNELRNDIGRYVGYMEAWLREQNR